MPETIFYAWQSDLPSKTNRAFIRDCLDHAIDALNTELGIEDALRGDQDTQGEPGDINISEVIFRKIDQCRVFVCDVTTVTPAQAARPMPNPNVLIEYGRASITPGSAFVMQVFNSAFGDWERDRPFDLRHRRRPILYTLAADDSPEQRDAARRSLVRDITSALREILRSAPPTLAVPNTEAFDMFRVHYMRTSFRERTRGRIIGFWCGLISHGDGPQLDAPWTHKEWMKRDRAFSFRGGAPAFPFPAIDAGLGNGGEMVRPFQGGATYLQQYHYSPSNGARDPYFDDVVAVHLFENGRVLVTVRTNNLLPAPNLRREWIIVEALNSLLIADRARTAAGKPNWPYSLVVELRYDEQSDERFGPVQSGEWRLCILGEEQGHRGPLVPSDPITIGPIIVGQRAGFPEILRAIYTSLVTSSGRTPEPDLRFDFE